LVGTSDIETVITNVEDVTGSSSISVVPSPSKSFKNDLISPNKATDASWSSEDYRQAMDTSETNEIIFKSPVKANTDTAAKVCTCSFDHSHMNCSLNLSLRRLLKIYCTTFLVLLPS